MLALEAPSYTFIFLVFTQMGGNGLSFMYPTFPIMGSISLVLCLIAVPAHWSSGNIAVVSLALYNSVGLLICIIDATVWHGNIRNPYPIWGDIVQVYFVILGPAIASCMLCIQYRLWSVAHSKSVFITKREKQMQRYTTIFVCFGVPLIIGLLHYVVQGHRYNIWEDLGPMGETYNTWLAFPLYYMWDPLICLVSGILAMHTIALFLSRRKEVDVALNSGSINIHKSRYVRLMCLAAVAIFIHLPLSSWLIIVCAAVYPVYPWISWEDTHSNYHRIEYLTRFLINVSRIDVIYACVSWFSLVLCGIAFFVLFGFGEQANHQYLFTVHGCLGILRKWCSLKKKRDVVMRQAPRSGRPMTSISQLTSEVSTKQSQIGDDIVYSEMSEMKVDLPKLTSMQPWNESSKSAGHSPEEKTQRMSGISEEKVEICSVSTPATDVRLDLEANHETNIAIGEERRQKMLERNPELTEEMTF